MFARPLHLAATPSRWLAKPAVALTFAVCAAQAAVDPCADPVNPVLPKVTTTAGAPVTDIFNIGTAGPCGPALLQDVWLLETQFYKDFSSGPFYGFNRPDVKKQIALTPLCCVRTLSSNVSDLASQPAAGEGASPLQIFIANLPSFSMAERVGPLSVASR